MTRTSAMTGATGRRRKNEWNVALGIWHAVKTLSPEPNSTVCVRVKSLHLIRKHRGVTAFRSSWLTSAYRSIFYVTKYFFLLFTSSETKNIQLGGRISLTMLTQTELWVLHVIAVSSTWKGLEIWLYLQLFKFWIGNNTFIVLFFLWLNKNTVSF